ncbi:dicarboxylate/amino acid:cation symporter [Rossellomorea sp. NPDC071047]|uniref:dicarboxylate/amino acid:cation symporter n=1 Tax=Rossellomorea sp. NPDC071047 TaxID=3390675 RepID=UPI003CFF2969
MAVFYGVLVSVAVVLGVFYLIKIKIKLGIQILITMAIGILAGILLEDSTIVFSTIGQGFVGLLKMLVIPLVFFTLISSIINIQDIFQLRKIGLKTFTLFIVTAIIASIIGILTALAVSPWQGIKLSSVSDFEIREIPSFSEVFLNFIPSNPFGNMVNDEVIPIVIFSILIGVSILLSKQHDQNAIQPVEAFFRGFSQALFQLTKMVIKLSPIGVFALMANVSSSYGIETLLPLSLLILTVYIACIIHIIFTYGSLIGVIAKVNPFGFFYRAFPAMAVAFSTRSSYGTLPVSINVITQRLKVSKKIANFVAPLGATINMDACGGIYPAIVAVFVSNIYGIELTFVHYALIVLTATIASVGTAGVPGTASIMATVVLSSAGLPVEGLALVLAVDPILDMARTTVNVTGDLVVSLIVGKSEGEWDQGAYEDN